MQPVPPRRPLRDSLKVLRSSAGSFDLPSILVGVVVVAILTAGVLAAIFGVIPFVQDNGAKQDLESVRTGEGVSKAKDSKFVNLAGLDSGGYVKTRPGMAVGTDVNGACYVAVSHSGSGRDFIATSKAPTPVELTGAPDTGCIPASAVADLASQAGKPAPGMMRTTWDTSLSPSCTTITIPLTGTIDASINWGDGTTDMVTTGLPSHTYAGTPGIQSVTIEGTFTGWETEAYPDWSRSCLTKVTEWGETGTTDAEWGFAETTHLTEVARMPSTVKSFSGLFHKSSFNGSVDGWDTSKVENMSYMFDGASAFNQPLSGWNTAKVTDMKAMFYEAVAFDQPLNGWDTSKATDMSAMFNGASSFNQDLSGWNVSSGASATGFSTGSALTPEHLLAGALFR